MKKGKGSLRKCPIADDDELIDEKGEKEEELEEPIKKSIYEEISENSSDIKDLIDLINKLGNDTVVQEEDREIHFDRRS